MKYLRIFSILAFLCAIYSSQAQVQLFNSSSLGWSYHHGNDMYGLGFGVKGTESHNGKTYFTIRQELIVYYGEASSRANFVFPELGIRVDGNRWLVDYEQYLDYLSKASNMFFTVDTGYMPYKLTDNGEMVLYDFGMQVGDKFASVPGYEDVYVVKTLNFVNNNGYDWDSDCLSPIAQKALLLSNGLVLVENVGCVNSKGRLLCYLNINEADKASNDVVLNELENDFFLWTSEESRNVIAAINSNTAVSGIKKPVTSSPVFDLQGRRVANPQKGIYVRNGKKVVVK